MHEKSVNVVILKLVLEMAVSYAYTFKPNFQEIAVFSIDVDKWEFMRLYFIVCPLNLERTCRSKIR